MLLFDPLFCTHKESTRISSSLCAKEKEEKRENEGVFYLRSYPAFLGSGEPLNMIVGNNYDLSKE